MADGSFVGVVVGVGVIVAGNVAVNVGRFVGVGCGRNLSKSCGFKNMAIKPPIAVINVAMAVIEVGSNFLLVFPAGFCFVFPIVRFSCCKFNEEDECVESNMIIC